MAEKYYLKYDAAGDTEYEEFNNKTEVKARLVALYEDYKEDLEVLALVRGKEINCELTPVLKVDIYD